MWIELLRQGGGRGETRVAPSQVRVPPLRAEFAPGWEQQVSASYIHMYKCFLVSHMKKLKVPFFFQGLDIKQPLVGFRNQLLQLATTRRL